MAEERGLIIGKFLPPHAGHLHLIDVARARVARLTVLVCSLASEPIPGAKRLEWLRELRPDVDFRAHTDENPQEPADDPRFWEIWTASIRRLVPSGPDLVFSSEEYGEELARRLGAKAVLVDLARRAVPVSGRAIRADPMRHWEAIPPPVRPWFAKRVLVTGAESTGKTTLARALAERFRTVWVPEFARGWLDLKGPVEGGPTAICELADMEPIARGQVESEERLARDANRIVFCDTDPAVTEVYSRHYFGVCPPWVEEQARTRRYDLALLAGTGIPWEADRQRDLPHLREEMQERFRRSLVARGIPFLEVEGSPEERVSRAAAEISRRFGAAS